MRSSLNSKANLLRGIPLSEVLKRFGCVPDPKDIKRNWSTPVGRITVNLLKDDQFYAQEQEKGGGGAIDLTMVLLETNDFKVATAWLEQQFGANPAVAAPPINSSPATSKTEPPPYKAPEPAEQNWPMVRDYLTNIRCLSINRVERVHELGKLYADKYCNAVFVLGKNVGVELRGTGSKPFHCVLGEKAPFIIAPGNEGRRVAFTESAIDAMSLRELGFEGRIVSLTGSAYARSKDLAQKYRKGNCIIVAAFDRDAAGDKMAEQLGQPYERLYPNGKDWNADLQQLRKKNNDAHCEDESYPCI